MKISLNWLKQYLQIELAPEKIGEYLTGCGLEVENIEEFETVKGGLRGFVIGKVLTCEEHPDSDHLHLTTVDIAGEQPLNIVCGAANIAAGQMVVVATIGAVIYQGDSSFTIKKSKIRGATSEGMICAEDELGLGTSHDGIMVLPGEATPGTPAADYFNIEKDYVFEIGLTPNRSDAMSHFGVARDLHAVLTTHGEISSPLIFPKPYDAIPNAKKNKIDITIENKTACPRYSGLVIEDVTVSDSPDWLKNRLRSIGIRPINNIVDITQYVMFELGQPLHAFDADAITGDKVILKNLPEGTVFTTLDGAEIKLSTDDLMVCNAEKGICIAGVYGGFESGVTEKTRNIFLESAYFDAKSVRRTSKRHHLKTDAAFRYERGCDPSITVFALKRAVNLIQEITGASVISEISDVYPSKIERKRILLSFLEIEKIIGKKIEKNTITNILMLLGMEVENAGEEQIMVKVPLYRVDVTRPVDLVEEILRIYGYNNVEIPDTVTYPLTTPEKNSRDITRKVMSTYLADNGFYEIMTNSLTKSIYAEKYDFINREETIPLLNPLSSELNGLRQTLLFSGLETIASNINNKNMNLRLFEFGRVYGKKLPTDGEGVTGRFHEKNQLALFVTGKENEDNWRKTASDLDFFYLKNFAFNLLEKVGVSVEKLTSSVIREEKPFIHHLTVQYQDDTLVRVGEVHPAILKDFDLKKPVYHALFNMDLLLQISFEKQVGYTPVPVYPAVKRDLALLIDKEVSYARLEEVAVKYGGKLLKSISLFDVYEGERIEEGKKSYALNFVLQNDQRTLTEEDINKTMNKLIHGYQSELGATLRS